MLVPPCKYLQCFKPIIEATITNYCLITFFLLAKYLLISLQYTCAPSKTCISRAS